MLNRIASLDILIGNCNYRLRKAEDAKNLDMYNYWFCERERLFCERASLLSIKLGGV